MAPSFSERQVCIFIFHKKIKLRADATLIENPVLECEHCDHRDCLNSFTTASILQGLG